MKKVLTFIAVVVFCATLNAQQNSETKTPLTINQSEASKKTSYEKYLKTPTNEWNGFDEVVPTLRTSTLMANSEEKLYNIIGTTHYNTVTNSNARNTVSFRNNSDDAAAVWIMGTPANQGANRGTGINYFNINTTTWGEKPNPATERIEDVRTGWGGHAFTEQGEIVVSHHAPLTGSAQGLVINTRDQQGTGNWTQYILQGPAYTINGQPSTSLNWPSVVAVGNTVHLFCVTASAGSIAYNESGFPDPKFGYKGYSTYPLYYRSHDGGKTWEEPVDFPALGLMTSYETFKFGGDDYVITAKGEHIVILFSAIYGLVYYLESFDNGNTWERHTVFHIGEVFLNTYAPEVGPLLLPRSGAVTIDDDDVVHVAFTTVLDKRTMDGISYYYAFPTGIIYWNSTMEQLNWQEFTVTFDPYGDNHIIHYKDYSGHIPLPSVVGLKKYYCWTGGPTYKTDQFGNSGWAAFARLIAKDGRVYVSYQAPLDYPLNFEVNGEPVFCRGIFVTVSEDNGASWDVPHNTSWISYHPDLLKVDWSNYIEPEFDADGNLIAYYGGYVEAGIEVITENAYPTMSYNTKGDLFMVQWLNHSSSPFPGGGGSFENDPMTVFTFIQDLKNIPAYKNIDEVWRGLWNDIPSPQLCEKPVNISGSGNGSSAHITWDIPVNIDGILTGYNVYRDGILIGTAVSSSKEYIDKNLDNGTYVYKVSARYLHCPESELTDGVTVTIFVPQFCEKPLEPAGINEGATVIITWKEPVNIDGVLLGYNVYRNGEKINEALLSELEYRDENLDIGTYIYQISAVYEHCESELTEEISITINAIHDFHAASFKIYPNPANSELKIEVAGQARNDVQSVEIFDVYGRKVGEKFPSVIPSAVRNPEQYGQQADGVTINISHLPAGIYFVKITTENGIITKKIIKH